MADNILVAKTTFTTTYEGERVVIKKGKTRVREGHPLAVRNPGYFEPMTVHFDVETARSEPVVPQAPAPPAQPVADAKPPRRKAAKKAAAEKAGDE